MAVGRISLDTEATGKDIRHGVLPYFVSSADLKGDVLFWEWFVDPLTRIPRIPKGDLEEICDLVNEASEIVFHNAKFDVPLLQNIGIHKNAWPWGKTIDTMYYCHLLANTQPKDLGTASAVYLGKTIDEYERAIDEATKEALKIVKREFPDWNIAREGLPTLPSQKSKFYKCDMWVPRLVARELSYPEDHFWWRVLQEYGCTDAHCTVFLSAVQDELIETRNLRRISDIRQKMPRIIEKMESVGVSICSERVEELLRKFREDIEFLGNKCVRIAGYYGMPLTIPKSGNNGSLTDFVFGEEGLGLKPVSSSEKTGKPSLDKKVIETYKNTLPKGSEALEFIQSIAAIRERSTSVSYLESYKSFWLPSKNPLWYKLFPSLNGTGTNTLRFTSQNPNEQNISKKGFQKIGKKGEEEKSVRYCFGPEPGREWWSFDAANIELRIPAYESGQEEMIALFERPNDPPYYGSNHLLVFHTLHPDLWEEGVRKVGWEKAGPYCKKEYSDTWYQRTKNGNFAVQYGAIQMEDGEGTADIAYGVPGAQRIIKARFSKQEELNQRIVKFAKSTGYVETMPDMTVDPEKGYPLLCTTNKWGRVRETVPLNYRVQGTAMWWMMKAMIRCQNFLDQLNSSEEFFRQVTKKKITRMWSQGYFMIMQVHDELVFDFPASYEPEKNYFGNLEIAKNIAALMRQGGEDIGVPTPVSCEYHPHNWGEGISVKLSV